MNQEDKKIQEERLEDSAADRREAKRIWLVTGTGAAVVLLIAAAAVLWGSCGLRRRPLHRLPSGKER